MGTLSFSAVEDKATFCCTLIVHANLLEDWY